MPFSAALRAALRSGLISIVPRRRSSCARSWSSCSGVGVGMPHRVVVQAVAGSSPVAHPPRNPARGAGPGAWQKGEFSALESGWWIQAVECKNSALGAGHQPAAGPWVHSWVQSPFEECGVQRARSIAGWSRVDLAELWRNMTADVRHTV